MSAVDAVVIGAGPNGLVAANLLADAGWSVMVLEEQAEPGGAVRTASLTAPGFHSDVCSSFYPLVAAHSPIARLGLEDEGLRWLRSPTVLTHLTPEGSAVTLATDLAATEASVQRWAAGDGPRWRRTYREWLQVERALLDALFTPFPPVRPLARMVRSSGIAGSMRLARRLLLPAATLGQELFAGEGARLLLGGLALHADVPLSSTASGGYGLLMAMLAQRYGFPVPEGGACALTQALVARLRRRGGDVTCRAPVAAIGVRHGAARTVHTAQGRTFHALRAVVADVTATNLYRRLLPRHVLPQRLLDDLVHFHYDPGTVKVDWALSGRIPWANPEAGRSGTVHLGVDVVGMARATAALEAGDLPEQPLLVCGQMSTVDPTRSPAGTEAFWAYTHLPHRGSWSMPEVADVVRRMEEAVEAQAPGFTDRVIARHVTGPAEFERENANLVGGALGGGTSAVHQQLVFRPVPGLGRADTPIDRLYLASASAHPGGGVHGAPGANAARAALARDRAVSGRLYRATVQGAQRRIYPT